MMPGLALALGLILGGDASACPNCKEAVDAQPHELGAMKNGYNYSVLFMMAMPFTLLGAGSLMIARAVKRGTLPEM
jgi:hypothetical protein